MYLREYETDWLARVTKSKSKRILIVGPTGSGKTVVAAVLVKRAVLAGKRVLFLAHRRELISQACQRLVEAGVPHGQIGVILGVIDPEERDVLVENQHARVQVAVVQALTGVGTHELPPADLIVIDEAHRAPVDSYKEILDQYPKAIVHGLTATPYRLDERPLDDLFDEIVPSAPPSQLIEAGWLSKPLVYTVPRDQRPKLLGLRKRDKDFDTGQLARVTDLPHLVGSVVDHYLEYAKNRPTVVYGVNLAHCHHLTEQFRHRGVRAATVYGEMGVKARNDALDMFDKGELDVITNCRLLTEGWDSSIVRCAIVARATLSAGLWFQLIGRVTRPGKVQPIVLDHAGNALMHGLPLEDTDYSLKTRPRTLKPGSGAGEKQCPRCKNSVNGFVRVCGYCQHEWWKPNQIPNEAQGQLVQVERRDRRRKCSYAKCPTPHVVTKGFMHMACVSLLALEKHKCQYEHCLTPDKPLSQNNNTTMHRWCAVALRGSVPKNKARCTYEKCPRPDELFPSKPGSTRVMHGACLKLRQTDLRKCQYAKCGTPTILLSQKAEQQGITMHRACKARDFAERKDPTKPRCQTCGVRSILPTCHKCKGKQTRAHKN